MRCSNNENYIDNLEIVDRRDDDCCDERVSRRNDDCCNERIIRRNDDCCKFIRHPQPKKILLECGTCPQDVIFDTGRRGRRRRRDEEFILDRVIVDTSCLCRPQVKVDFSCIVCFEAEAERRRCRGAEAQAEAEGNVCEESSETETETQSRRERELEVDLEFELVRICNGVEETAKTWRYLKEYEIKGADEFEVEVSESFCVTFCDRECPGCCVYKMIVTLEDLDGDFDELRVVSPTLSVLAQGICGD